MSNLDEQFMSQALIEAKIAFQKQEVPIGAVLVYENKIIARAHNQVESLKNATAHAEILCIKKGAKVLDNWRLLDTTLYCTAEPCVMCGGALLLSRIKRLVWGAPDKRHGANGSWFDLFSYNHPTHHFEITSAVLAEKCSNILQDFFRRRR